MKINYDIYLIYTYEMCMKVPNIIRSTMAGGKLKKKKKKKKTSTGSLTGIRNVIIPTLA